MDGVTLVSETGLVRIVEAKMKIQMLQDELEQYHLLEQRYEEIRQYHGFRRPSMREIVAMMDMARESR